MVAGRNVSRRRAVREGGKKTAVRGRASQTAVGGESENREAKASYRFLYYPVGKCQSENLENVADLNRSRHGWIIPTPRIRRCTGAKVHKNDLLPTARRACR